jgi:hypothetical protein
MAEPEIITHLRKQLAAAQEKGHAGADPCATIVGRSAAALGIRPRVLAHNADGTKTYSLTVAQCKRTLDRFDAAGAELARESTDTDASGPRRSL